MKKFLYLVIVLTFACACPVSASAQPRFISPSRLAMQKRCLPLYDFCMIVPETPTAVSVSGFPFGAVHNPFESEFESVVPLGRQNGKLVVCTNDQDQSCPYSMIFFALVYAPSTPDRWACTDQSKNIRVDGKQALKQVCSGSGSDSFASLNIRVHGEDYDIRVFGYGLDPALGELFFSSTRFETSIAL